MNAKVVFGLSAGAESYNFDCFKDAIFNLESLGGIFLSRSSVSTFRKFNEPKSSYIS